MDEDRILFGDLLKQWREENGLSRSGLANALSYDISTIAKYERGERNPSGEFFAEMALRFDIEEDDIEFWIQTVALEFGTKLMDNYQRVIRNRRGNVK
jgi:transcriptional regulator with XRE-family HTH domain